eukprot:242328-Chlamydomonas_euryale.AAC.1
MEHPECGTVAARAARAAATGARRAIRVVVGDERRGAPAGGGASAARIQQLDGAVPPGARWPRGVAFVLGAASRRRRRRARVARGRLGVLVRAGRWRRRGGVGVRADASAVCISRAAAAGGRPQRRARR